MGTRILAPGSFLPWLSKIIPEKRTHMRDLWKNK